MPQKILVVDDDPLVTEYIRVCLENADFQISLASNGEEALEAVKETIPDLVLMDILMPKMDGKEACKRLSSLYSVPIIILSCCSQMADRIECLDMGADDYIIKPFHEQELVARVKAVLRRNQQGKPGVSPRYFKQNGLEIDFLARQILFHGEIRHLTQVEAHLLQELVSNTGKVLTYDYLLKAVWGDEYKYEKEYLHVYIGRLRAKLEADPLQPRYIVTVHGIGYVFKG